MSIEKLVSLHGLKAFLGSADGPLTGQDGVAAGGAGEPSMYYNSPKRVARTVDFVGDSGDITYLSNDTGQSSAVQAGTNGVFRLFSSPSATSTLGTGGSEEINLGGLQWKSDQGPGANGEIRVAARVKLGSVSRTTNRAHAFVGFKDVATIEHPAHDTGAGVISASADYVGFMFSPGGDTGWSGVAGKSTAGDSGDQVTSLDTGVAANTYDYLEVVVNRGKGDTGGVATFYINGENKGKINSPVASSAALIPCVSAFQQDTGSQYVDVDLLEVSGLRDTGL